MNPLVARAPALHELHAPVAARVLEGPHLRLGRPHHDDRLVEDLVLDEVVHRRGISSSRHAICQTRGHNASASMR